MKAFVRLGLLGAFIALAATVGIATSGRFATPADAQLPAGVTVDKACNDTTVAINATSQCIITINIANGAAPEPITIQARPSVGTGQTASGAVIFLDGVSGATGGDVDTVFINNPSGADVQSLVIGCFDATCSGTIVTTEGYRCAVGGPVNEYIQFGNGQFVQLQTSITCGPAQTTMAITCNPNQVEEVGTTTCRVQLNDNDVFPTTVSSGAVQLNVPANSGLTFQDSGTNTLNVRCPVAGFNQPQGCDFLDVVIRGGPGVGETVPVNGTYTPDLAGVNTTATAVFQLRVGRQPVSKTIRKECTPQPDNVPVPGRQVRVGDQVTCTVTITGQAGETGRATVDLTNATFAVGGGTSQTFDCVNTAPPMGTSCSFTETIFPTTQCIPVRERIRLARADGTVVFDQTLGIPNAQGQEIEVLPKGTGTCQDPVSKRIEKVCTPQPDNVPVPGRQVRVGDQLSCTVRVIGEPGEAARVTVELTNATFGTGGGTTQTFDCVNTQPPSGTTCQFIETLFPTAPCIPVRERIIVRRPFDNTVLLQQDFGIPNAQGQEIEVLPKGTGTCQMPSKTFTKVCTPNVDGVPNQATQVRVGGTVTCIVTITGDQGEAGRATVELTNAIFPGVPANAEGLSIQTFDCVNLGPGQTSTSCRFTETFEPTTPCVVIRERVIFRRTFDNTVVLDQVIPVANAQGVVIEVLPKGTGTCQDPSKTITKVCAAQPDGVPVPGRQVRVGQSVTCTVTITGQAGEAGRAQVDLTNATFPDGSSTRTFDCVNVGPGQGSMSCRFEETFFPTTACQPMSQRIRFRRTFDDLIVLDVTPPIANSSGQVIEILPKDGGDCTAPAQVSSVRKSCQPIIDGVPAPTTTQRFVRVGQTVTCNVEIITPTGFSPTTARVTLGAGASFAGVASGGTPDPANPNQVATFNLTNTGTTSTHGTRRVFECTGSLGTTGTVTPLNATTAVDVQCTETTEGTTTVTGRVFSFSETFVAATPCINLGPETVAVGGSSFTARVVDASVDPARSIFVLPKLDSGVECPGGASQDRFAGQLAFICQTNAALAGVVGDPFIAGIPGQVRDNFVAGIGILPQALACKVIPIPVGVDPAICLAPFATVTGLGLDVNALNIQVGTPTFNLGNVAQACGVVSGKIEVSSINGALIDLTGRLTTNLRIECGDISGVFVPLGATASNILPTINKNTCFGVTFGVAGLGVGLVELNARYEPATFAGLSGAFEVEGKAAVAFIAPAVSINLLLSPNPVTVGQTGTATARFNRVAVTCEQQITAAGILGPFGAAASTGFCVDPTTGAQVLVNIGSILNGTVLFQITDTAIASFVGAAPTATQPAPSSTAGFTTTANQAAVRCGFFPTTGLPFSTINTGSSVTPAFPPGTTLQTFFGGCESVSVNYRGNVPGATQVTATFIPDLPGAFGTGTFSGSAAFGGLPQTLSPLLGSFAGAVQSTAGRVLEVIGAAPSGVINLVRGCNNVTPTVSETVSAYAARVMPTSAVIAIWEHQAATNTFRGAPGPNAPAGAAAVADLSEVRRLVPVFVCVNAAATLNQPAV